jgi:hypothetical protein
MEDELWGLMKKLVLFAAVIAAFSVSSALAGSCPGSGGCGDKDKDKEEVKDGEKQTLTVEVNL